MAAHRFRARRVGQGGGLNILFLATDAWGGHGGIAHYNRCLTQAMAEQPDVSRITVMPRVVQDAVGELPGKVEFLIHAAGSKARFLQVLAGQLRRPFDLVICGHINLAPITAVFCALRRVPMVLQVHGIDAWQAPGLPRKCATRFASVIWSVSGVTRDRMNAWAKLPADRYTVIPNTIDMGRFGLALRRADLIERYGLEGRKVILTLARLDPRERYKGIDEILDVLPKLARLEPTITYLIAGSGDDRARLEAKAATLGVADRVVFTGRLAEAEKADHLRLADAFVMPGRGEGFGIVYLEALACGVPVVGSKLDGSREALRDGALGALVDPEDRQELGKAILDAIQQPRRMPEGLAHFLWPQYSERVSSALAALMPGSPASRVAA